MAALMPLRITGAKHHETVFAPLLAFRSRSHCPWILYSVLMALHHQGFVSDRDILEHIVWDMQVHTTPLNILLL